MNLASAQKLIQQASNTADSMGLKVSICIVDTHGVPVALARMDGARVFTGDVARGKAMVSALFGRPSGSFGEGSNPAVLDNINKMNGDKMFFVQGAVPITEQEVVTGAIGVSGATAQQDEDIAKSASDAI